jgi:hypothetical protein
MGRASLLLCLVVVMGCNPTPGTGHEGSSTRGPSTSPARLDPEKVPADLRPLVPLAQEWGIGDDLDRGVKIEQASPTERERLREAVAPHQERITAWLATVPADRMSDEAAAFMYLQLAIEEIPDAESPR